MVGSVRQSPQQERTLPTEKAAGRKDGARDDTSSDSSSHKTPCDAGARGAIEGGDCGERSGDGTVGKHDPSDDDRATDDDVAGGCRPQ